MKRLIIILILLALALAAPAQQKANLTASGTTCASGVSAACLSVSVDPTQGGATFTLTGTFSATVQFEASGDGGTTWVALNVTPSNSTTAVTSATGTGTWQANVAGYTNVRERVSTFSSGPVVASIIESTASARAGGGGGGAGGGGGGGVSTYTFFPSTAACSFTNYSPTGTTYCAMNGLTGLADFSGTDAAVVVNSAMTAVTATGGTFYFRNGIYNGNSCTLEVTSPYTNYCFVWGIPAVAGAATYPQFNFVGESANFGMEHGTLGLPLETDVGVIFNITAAARTAAGANILVGWWKRPNFFSLAPGEWNGPVSMENIGVRFPDNQRGNEYAIDMLEATQFSTIGVDTNYLSQPTTLAAAGEKGIVSPSTYDDGMYARNIYMRGSETCLEINGEHTAVYTPYLFECTTGLAMFKTYNREGINSSYPITVFHALFYNDVNQVDIGTKVFQGMLINFPEANVEKAVSGPWVYQTGATEETPGITGGTVSWVYSDHGIVNGNVFFTSGGQNYKVEQPSWNKTTGNKYTSSTAFGDFSTAKTTLSSYTVPAKTLLYNSFQPLALQTVAQSPGGGDYLLVRAWGATRANGNSKTLTIDWGGTTVSTVTSTVSGGTLSVEAKILTDGITSNSQKAIGTGMDGVAAPALQNATTTIDTSVDEVIAATATTGSFAGTGPFPLTLYSYNFSVVENPLSDGGNFTNFQPCCILPKVIAGNIAEPTATATPSAAFFTGPGTWPNDQYSEVTIKTLTASNTVNALVRSEVSTCGAGCAYKLEIDGPLGSPVATERLVAFINGGNNTLDTFTLTVAANDKIGLSVKQISPTSALLTVWQNNTSVRTFTDSILATNIPFGTPGFLIQANDAIANCQISNWAGGLPTGGGTNADFTLQGFTVDYVVGTH
jgi:hypothetical protein